MISARLVLRRGAVAALAASALACAPASQPGAPSQQERSRDVERLYEPSRDLGQLFHDVQMARIYPDGKTFVDARPLMDPAEIVKSYNASKASALAFFKGRSTSN